MKQFEVTLANSGKTFLVNEGENILAAALRQGVMLPYSCKNGTCGSCKGTLVAGSVHYPFHPPQALEDDEMEQGAALMCQAEPLDNLIVSVREIEAVRQSMAQRGGRLQPDTTLSVTALGWRSVYASHAEAVAQPRWLARTRIAELEDDIRLLGELLGRDLSHWR